MASSNRFFALDLGMQTLALAEFQATPQGGLCLNRFFETELIVDPAADATRVEQIRLSVEELKKEAGCKNGETVHLCLPSQSVFTRFVKLPGASAEDVRSVIAFEAQQNVPFPIDEVVWDYQILGESKDGNWDVVLVAIKSDQLSELNDAVQQSGLRVGKIDVAPMALYNAFRFNYADSTGTSLLIDIGSRTTNLIFLNGDKVFSRGIPIGGNAITGSISKELEADMLLAERLKKEKGIVGLGGSYAEPEDPSEAKIAKLTRSTLTRLHAEIARSIGFYRANQGGSQPVRVILSGGTVAMPYMVEFFNEKLQMPVEFFNPLRNVTVNNEEVASSIDGKVHRLGELVGLGLRGTGASPVEINLRPLALIRQQDMAGRQRFLIAAILLAGLGLVGLGLHYQKAAEVQSSVNDGIAAERTRLTALAEQMDAAIAERRQLESQAAPLLLAASERYIWASLVDELGTHLPERSIWVTQMNPLSAGSKVDFGDARPLGGPGAGRRPTGGPAIPQANDQQAAVIDAIEIRGLYLENPQVIDEFVKNLSGSELFSIGSDRSVYLRERTSPDGTAWAYSYTIVLPLKTPISLQ